VLTAAERIQPHWQVAPRTTVNPAERTEPVRPPCAETHSSTTSYPPAAVMQARAGTSPTLTAAALPAHLERTDHRQSDIVALALGLGDQRILGVQLRPSPNHNLFSGPQPGRIMRRVHWIFEAAAVDPVVRSGTWRSSGCHQPRTMSRPLDSSDFVQQG